MVSSRLVLGAASHDTQLEMVVGVRKENGKKGLQRQEGAGKGTRIHAAIRERTSA